jgi:putative Holliday junction resolvase
MDNKRKRIAALDLGDVWTGVAISDDLFILAEPLETVETKNIIPFLTNFFKQYPVTEVIVGIPVPLRGAESQQTKKTKEMFSFLQSTFSHITFIPFDESFSSAQASEVQKGRKKGTWKKIKAEKLKNHAIAAAFILTNYLEMHAAWQHRDE